MANVENSSESEQVAPIEAASHPEKPVKVHEEKENHPTEAASNSEEQAQKHKETYEEESESSKLDSAKRGLNKFRTLKSRILSGVKSARMSKHKPSKTDDNDDEETTKASRVDKMTELLGTSPNNLKIPEEI